MKKILFLLTMFIFANAKSQDTCINDARIYTNTNITANGARAITGAKLNTSLNKIIDAIDCVGGGVFIATDSNTVINYNVLNSQNAPPVSPIAGDTYLVGTVPTGAWVGHAKDIATWDGSAWTFIDGVQGDYLYNTTNLLTYIYRSGNWVQTGGIPALNNGNTISSGLTIGTNNLRSLEFETNNSKRGRFDSIGRFHVYDTSLRHSNKYLQIDSITGRLIASDISSIGGTSALFPNGIEFVSESRDFNSGDANKLLTIKSDDITLSMPSVNPFGEGDLVGIQNINDFKNTHIILEEGNEPILIGDEVFIFDLVDIGGGIYVPQPLTGIIYDENEENTKSIIRYLYDKSANSVTPLSSLSPATSANVIDNGNETQEWQWNSQINTPMLKLSSTSTSAVNGGNGLEINLSGNLTTLQTTYAAKFINTRASGGGINSGAYFEGAVLSGIAIQTKHSGASGTSGGADIAIGSNGALRWNNGNYNGCYIQSLFNTPAIEIGSVGVVRMVAPSGVYLKANTFNPFIIEKAGPGAVFSIGAQSETKQASIFGGGLANSSQYASASSTLCVIERDLGKLNFSANVGLTPFTALPPLTYQICVDGTNNNVAIGKGNTAGDASAKLEVASTTQGFLPPRMTATQASAIASPAQGLLLFVSDTNGTFTSVGWWGYNGSTWEKLNN